MNSIELMEQAIPAALLAGAAILEVYNADQKGFEIAYKADHSPLTKADRAAHETIVKQLANTPIPLLSEEGKAIDYQQRRNWDRFWMVDPLDGTKEFIKRNGEFTVNIALIDQQQAIGGIIYVPVLQQLYFALTGEGAWRMTASTIENTPADWNQLKTVSDPLSGPPAKLPYTVVASRSHLNEATQAFIRSCEEQHTEVQTVSRGSSLKFCMLAEGQAHCYPRYAPTMEWDTAAGQALVEACGFQVIRADNGAPLRYNRENLLNPGFLVDRPQKKRMTTK